MTLLLALKRKMVSVTVLETSYLSLENRIKNNNSIVNIFKMKLVNKSLR